MEAKEIAEKRYWNNRPLTKEEQIKLAGSHLDLLKQMEELKGENDGLTLSLLRLRKQMGKPYDGPYPENRSDLFLDPDDSQEGK